MTLDNEIPSRYNEDLVHLVHEFYEDTDTLSIADINAGHFGLFRKLAPRIKKNQVWLLIDHDEERLQRLRESLQIWAEHQQWQFYPEEDEYFSIIAGRYTWRGGIKVVPKKDLFEQLNFAGIRLLVASRYLEYQSEHWVQTLLTHTTEAKTSLLFDNNYSGQFRWIPSDVKDATILAAWHRARRKILGEKNSILADRAAYYMSQQSALQGYQTYLNKSLKTFDKTDDTFILKQLKQMEDDVKNVIRDESRETLERWLSKKRYTVSGGIVKLEMGLADILALAPKE